MVESIEEQAKSSQMLPNIKNPNPKPSVADMCFSMLVKLRRYVLLHVFRKIFLKMRD